MASTNGNSIVTHEDGERVIGFYRASGEFGFLSNLYRRVMYFEERRFNCSEEAYQYGKPSDPVVAEWLVSAPKPHLVAAAAHALFVFDVRADWNATKVERMRRVLREKFKDPELRAKLLATRPHQLVEQSKIDAFWGIGKKGNGKNMLGVLLMETRDELAAEPSKG